MAPQRRILAFVLAGGEGARLLPLTASLPKPALHFVDGYRIVDIVLSNLLNSGIDVVYVIAQYKPRALMAHVDNAWRGRFRSAGGFVRTVLPPGWPESRFRGTADAVRRNLELVQEHRPDLVAVFAADHVYRMDVRQMASFHCACSAEITVATARVPLAAASSFGIVLANAQHRILAFEEKPEHPPGMAGDPAHACASMGNYLFEPRTLVRALDRCARDGGTDFGYHVMPQLPHTTRAYAHDLASNQVPGLQCWEKPDYWRDIGTPEALRAAREEAAGPARCFNLANGAWPMHKERRQCPRIVGGNAASPRAGARLGAQAAEQGGD